MSQIGPARTSSLSKLATLGLILCLMAPSVWMIATIPPLWRDMDAYNQATLPPLASAFWGHALAYGYLTKVPFFLGEQFERQIKGTDPGAANPSIRPALTNTGIELLIVAQHTALCFAALYFIVTIASSWLLRFALTLLWVSNPLFYMFAHCVGSESLSMIAILFLVTIALRLVLQSDEVSWKQWYRFACVLVFCLLCRHINLWLILLLPITFLLAGLWDWLRGRASRNFRLATIAIMVGLAALVATQSFSKRLAKKTRFPPHSRLGFTFLWRLNFVKALSPEERTALFEKVMARTSSEETRKFLGLLQEMENEEKQLNATEFVRRAIPLRFPDGKIEGRTFDESLNRMAWAFLLPPTPEQMRAVRTDFVNALKMPVSDVSNWLFETTAYYFQHEAEMPAFASLSTFTNTDAYQIRTTWTQHRWFSLWKSFNYLKALAVWLATLIGAIVLSRVKRNTRMNSVVLGFSVALVIVGLLTIASTCTVGEFIPRYGLPMWQFLLLAVFSVVGGALSRGAAQGNGSAASNGDF